MCIRDSSGNRLREPVSGKPVSVVYIGDLKGFCDSVDGVVHIPYRAVGTRAGLLPAVIFEKMEIVWEKRTVEIQRPVSYTHLDVYKRQS